MPTVVSFQGVLPIGARDPRERVRKQTIPLRRCPNRVGGGTNTLIMLGEYNHSMRDTCDMVECPWTKFRC